VRDFTGLPGVYDIKIQRMPAMPASDYAAVQELGLRLQVQKVPVEVLVVDHVERVPTLN